MTYVSFIRVLDFEKVPIEVYLMMVNKLCSTDRELPVTKLPVIVIGIQKRK